MLKRALLTLVAGFGLIGNAPSDEIPAALAPYVVEGQLKTDDFSWMRGAFDGASEQQKADWKSIQSWVGQCVAEGKTKAIAELKLLGIESANLNGVPLGSPLCSSVARFNGMTIPTRDWSQFQANEARAREIFSIYEFGAKTAKLHGAFEPKWGTKESWHLLRTTVMEQVYRIGSGWNTESGAPRVNPAYLPYLDAHMGDAMMKEDRSNTEMLKQMVAAKGWPTISLVGERASVNAWLLTQHADHDPAFQLRSLRMMEPLVAKREVSKSNYAYLYDRIMLKLTGKQRFGTQFMGCDGDEHKLRPLEDEGQLDKLRSEYELEPIDEYRRGMKDAFGPCKAN